MSDGSQRAVATSGIGSNKYAQFVLSRGLPPFPVSTITPIVCRSSVCMKAALRSRGNCVEIEGRAVFHLSKMC
jgi:hypothetical protein